MIRKQPVQPAALPYHLLHHLEGFGLGNGAGETVEDDTFAGAQRIVNACQDANHQIVGDELAVVNKTLGGLAQFGAFLDFSAEHIAGRDMLESIFFHEEGALGALAGAWSSEDYNIFHGYVMF